MSNTISDILDNNMPVDYEGYLAIESNVQEKSVRKVQIKKSRKMEMAAYENCRESAGSAKTASSNKRVFAPPVCDRQVSKGRKPEESEYGILNDLIKRVRAIERAHNASNKRLNTEIQSLNRRVAQAEYKNVVMDVQIHFLKNELNHNNKQIDRLTLREAHQLPEIEHKYMKQQKYTGKRLVRDRQQVLSKDENAFTKNSRPYGHQRLKSAGFDGAVMTKRPMAY